MSGEDASSSGSGSGGGAAIPHDYSSNTNKHERSSNHNKPPMFNGDLEMFSWWKTKMYSHIIGMDEELWDILEEGVGDLKLDEEGAALDRKAQSTQLSPTFDEGFDVIGEIQEVECFKSCG